MILDLLKFGLVFFLPTIIGRLYKFYYELKTKNFSMIRWKSQKLSYKIVSGAVLVFVISKLASIFVFGPENFFSKINARIDSPSYIIRNHYRSYLESLTEKDAFFREMIKAAEGESDASKFQGMQEYQELLNMKILSEQLKIKDKKSFYSKYGEHAFLNCEYCVNDIDFVMYLAPSIILQYSLFLILIGILSANTQKSKWRNYGLFLAAAVIACEAYAFLFPSESATKFDPYDLIFGDDFFTLRYEKITFLRDCLFILFLLVVLLFDNGQDLRLKSIFDQLRASSETSLALLQATRIQEAALSIDETLLKFSKQSKKNNPSHLSAIISDPGFRQKVAESGHKLDLEELMEQKSKNIDDLLKLTKLSQ